MITALGLALLAAIEPLGVVAFIAVLGSRGGRRNTRGFIAGWMLCACVVALVTVLAAGSTRSGHLAAVVGSAGLLQVALGVTALIYVILRHRREPVTRARSDDDGLEEDHLGPVGAAMIAAALQGWPVVAAAVGAVLTSTDQVAGRVLGVAAVVVVATSTYLTAHVLAGRRPERTAAWLGSLRGWIERHRDRAVDLLLLGAGGYLVVHGALVQLAK